MAYGFRLCVDMVQIVLALNEARPTHPPHGAGYKSTKAPTQNCTDHPSAFVPLSVHGAVAKADT